ncbi:MAG: DUF6323 family protein [Candidatus Onthomonas sp.]
MQETDFWRMSLSQPLREAELARCNARSAPFGLVLTQEQAVALALSRQEALRSTGRVEFGPGPLEGLVAAFCDAPDLDPADYAGTLEELQALFYQLKGVSRETLSDSELICAMRRIYDRTGGSLDALSGADWEMLLEAAQGEGRDAAAQDWEDEDGELD